ncbi:DUF3618 domain-containing protein [Nocardia vulneris]|uniref:DUF3618 domain-containing protein n=1 Tax=Nocardia vulneris TaxID=1141657 RepID=UPI0030D3A074
MSDSKRAKAEDPIVSGPIDEEALRQDRDETREQLGQTVSELTDKLDVKARTKNKLHDTADNARAKAASVADNAKTTAAEKTAQAEELVSRKASEAKEVAGIAADQAKNEARRLADRAEAATPDSVMTGGRQAAGFARRQPVPVAVAAAFAAVLVWWIVRRRQA